MSVRAFSQEFDLNLATFRNWLYKKTVRVRQKKPCSASRKKPNFDKRKEPKLPELYLLFRVIQAVPLLERLEFF